MSPLFLSHHPPSQYDRCFRVGGQHVCRRCAVLYPLAFAVAIASFAGAHWPEAWDRTLLYLLPLPVTLEFVVERLGGLRYHAGRQIALTLLAAPALGRGFARYVAHPGDRLFWTMVLLFGGSALLALLLTAGRGSNRDQS
jgi:peptidoglycan/LPS O-acetylase OafA/YrhL